MRSSAAAPRPRAAAITPPPASSTSTPGRPGTPTRGPWWRRASRPARRGAPAEAQALWDRAAFDDATIAIRPELPAGAPPLHAAPALAWSRDGERLAVGGDGDIVVFDADLGGRLRLHTGETVLALAFSADRGLLVAGLGEGLVRVFDLVTGTVGRDLAGHRGAVRALVLAPDGRTLASAGEDGSVRIWDVAAGTELRALRPPHGATLLAFDAAGALLATTAGDGRVALWETQGFTLAGTLAAHGGEVRAMAFEGAALYVLTARERVRWDVTNPRRARAAVLDRAPVDRRGGGLGVSPIVEQASIVATSPGAVVATLAGPEVAVGDIGGSTTHGSNAAAYHQGIGSLALSPSGRSLAAVYRDRTIAVFPSSAPQLGGAARVLPRPSPVDAVAAAPDGKTLAAAADGRVLLWRADGDRLRALDAAGVRALAFSPDGRALAMGLAGAHVDFPALAGAAPPLVLDTHGAVQSVAFSPDGARLAVGTAAPSVQIFATAASAAGAAPSEPRSLHLEAGPVRAARFSPDGAQVLVASKEGLTLWSPTSHEGVRFVPYGPEVRDAAFTPDGTGMVVADQRGELLLGKPTPTTPAPTKTVLVAGQVMALLVAADGSIVTAEGDRSIEMRSPVGKTFQRFRDPDGGMRAVAPLSGLVAAGLDDGTVRLYRAPAAGPAAILGTVPGLPAGKVGGVVRGPGGHLEVVGPGAEAARAVIRCKLGEAFYPLDVCAEQFVVEGLLPMVLAGRDPAEADP